MRGTSTLLIAGLATLGLSLGSAWGMDHSAIEGNWDARGWDAGENPDQDDPYTGTATLEVQGESVVYQGEMDDMNYSGVGIWHADSGSLALHFTEQETGRVGVAHFLLSEDTLNGSWTFEDAPEEHGVEIWSRRTD